MRRRKTTTLFFVTIALILLLPLSSEGVVINEVMANEPGGLTTLEWIELYNEGPSSVSLAGWRMQVKGGWIVLPGNVWLEAGEYYLVCRKVFSDGVSVGFEQYWGNNSGVWGDCPEEANLQMPAEASFSLLNDGGTVRLFDDNGFPVSVFTWNQSGKDGYSWERVVPTGDVVLQCEDSHGATPGFVNSVTPLPHDLALTSVEAVPREGETILSFEVTNNGFNPSSETFFLLQARVDNGINEEYETIDSIPVAALLPGEADTLERAYFFDGTYAFLSALLPDDDRPRNNRFDFVAPGRDFPPLRLSEVMAAPSDLLMTEWVELRNVSSSPVTLDGWKLGDSLVSYDLGGEGRVLEPEEFLVVADDTSALVEFYGALTCQYLEPSQWASLNNSGDVVRLVDSFGIEADRFGYSETFADDYTWAWSEEAHRWGRSEEKGGTPCRENAVVYEAVGDGFVVTIEPRVFSPDGDGIEDEVAVTITSAPSDALLSMRLYDRTGRLVRTLFDGERFVKGTYYWDGRADSGKRVPIGMYILVLEAAGVEIHKEPLVVAR